LRTLEYFSGILFLTTNRVGAFDEAFRSRIHMAISYNTLTQESRRQIWRNFLLHIMPDADVYLDELAALDINGRNIRNLVFMAAGLAKGQSEQVDIKHIRQVMAASDSFNNYWNGMRVAAAT
jgi:AAA+ superfamily predicted ATPase